MCFGLPLLYIALRTFSLNSPITSTQPRAAFGRPRRSTSSIRPILRFWLSTCYLSYHRNHLSWHDPPAFTDSCNIHLGWYVQFSVSRPRLCVHMRCRDCWTSLPCPWCPVLWEEGLDLISYRQLVSPARRDGASGNAILRCLDHSCDVGCTISRIEPYREYVEESE